MTGTSSDGFDGAARPRLLEISVPEDLYEDVIEFIAERRRAKRSVATSGQVVAADAKASGDSALSAAVAPGDDVEAGGEWDPASIRGLLDQANERLVTALVALARSEEPLSTETITAAAGLQPGRSWGGFISRAQTSSRHRWGRDLPILFADWDGRNNFYRLEPSDAAAIREWAAENGL